MHQYEHGPKNKQMHFLSLFKILRTYCVRNNMRLYLFISIFTMISAVAPHHRAERQINGIPLVYPYGAIYKLLIGFASPVANKDNISLLFGVNFQYQYAQFTNISQLSRYYFIKKVSRELERNAGGLEVTGGEERRDERLVFYKSIADLMNAKGMNGPSCVLRAICEAAQSPVEQEGFVGEILHVLLTPDYGRTPFDDDPMADSWAELSPYTDAAIAGRQMFSCAAIYDGCPEGEGLMELISTLRDN